MSRIKQDSCQMNDKKTVKWLPWNGASNLAESIRTYITDYQETTTNISCVGIGPDPSQMHSPVLLMSIVVDWLEKHIPDFTEHIQETTYKIVLWPAKSSLNSCWHEINLPISLKLLLIPTTSPHIIVCGHTSTRVESEIRKFFCEHESNSLLPLLLSSKLNFVAEPAHNGIQNIFVSSDMFSLENESTFLDLVPRTMRLLDRDHTNALFSMLSENIRKWDNTGTKKIAIEAGILLWHGLLDESHSLSQSIEGNYLGDYWHAIMHRMEGDFGNSKYWYRRVGDSHNSRELAAYVINDHPHFQSELVSGNEFRSSSFVDLVEKYHRNTNADEYRSLQEIQEMEMLLLLRECV